MDDDNNYNQPSTVFSLVSFICHIYIRHLQQEQQWQQQQLQQQYSSSIMVTFMIQSIQDMGGAYWRRLKGQIKQAYFNQKPSPIRWDFDRA